MQYKRKQARGRVPQVNKYHNRQVEYDGKIFDSKKEASRYAEL